MLCRDAWGAKPPLPGGVTHKLSRMTLHHTGAVLGDNANAPGRLRQHQRLHQGERGWIDIAYHVGVDRNGNIYHLREPDLVGDTATEYNPTGHFLVLCEGDFDQEVATQEQVNSAALVFAWAAQRFNIPTDTLSGHKDFAATSCPGADLYAYLASGDLKRRVDDMVAAGPVSLQEICGEEAREKVAAIEAGQ
ncbi:N-acetylmuramoyl-L-alanine amidase [Mycobacterium sp. 1274761.0]|nr:N-acetylmuramoyl-L-alanine amidase [Mycobacterium sp. 1274761.0]